ncbi:MAG: mobile mystery protein A [Calditrichia bacterium]
MKVRDRELAREKLDKRLKLFRDSDLKAVPVKGWVKAIREALGMTTKQLGQRIGVSQPQVIKMEQSEARKAITLQSLERAANALGCELVYALVPREPLSDIIDARVQEAAKKQLRRTEHTMALEAQSVDAEKAEEQMHQLTKKILEKAGSNLWEIE